MSDSINQAIKLAIKNKGLYAGPVDSNLEESSFKCSYEAWCVLTPRANVYLGVNLNSTSYPSLLNEEIQKALSDIEKAESLLDLVIQKLDYKNLETFLVEFQTLIGLDNLGVEGTNLFILLNDLVYSIHITEELQELLGTTRYRLNTNNRPVIELPTTE